MNHLSDEIINNYADGSIDTAGLKLVKDHIALCTRCSVKIKTSMSLHHNLFRLVEYQTSNDFGSRVMKSIMTGMKTKKNKNYFFVFVAGTFIIAVVALFGLIFMSTSKGGGESKSVPMGLDVMTDFLVQLFTPLQALVNTQNLTFAGMIITLIIFISAYFLLDSHKDVKERLSKIN